MLLHLPFLWILIGAAMGLSQDQIFQNDWQTENIGIPVDSFFVGDLLCTLSSVGVFSVLNSSNGDVLYRFQHEQLPDSEFGLTKLNNSTAASVVNSIESKLLLWNTTSTLPQIEFQLDIQSTILDISLSKDLLYTVDQYAIVLHDLTQSTKKKLYEFREPIDSGKLYTNEETGETFVFWDTKGKTSFARVSKWMEPSPLNHCSISQIRFIDYKSNSFICDDSNYFEFDAFDVVKGKSGKYLLNKSLELTSLTKNIKNVLIDEDYVLIDTGGNIELFNHKNVTILPLKKYQFQHSFDAFEHISFGIVNDHLHLIGVSEEGEIHHFIDGTLSWERDESFTNIVDAVALTLETVPNKEQSELTHNTELNFLFSYTRRLKYNWKKMKEVLNIDENVFDVLGAEKYLLVLSGTNKIGVFAIAKDTDGGNQLLFTIKPEQYINRLQVIGNDAYAILGDDIMKIDLTSRILRNVSTESIEKFPISDIESIYLDDLQSKMYTAKHVDNHVQGYVLSNKDILPTWKFTPQGEVILSLTKRNYENNKVAQNGIILPDRSVLYKYLVPNVGILATYKEGSEIITIRLLDLITGQILGNFKKQLKYSAFESINFNISFEENFIIFTIPAESVTDTEVCVIDLFESLTPNEKKTQRLKTYSAFEDNILPAFASQCFIIPGKQIDSVTISNTKNNIALKEVIFTSKFGQVFSIPRMVLDGRRSGVMGDFNKLGKTSIKLNDATVDATLINFHESADKIVSKFNYDPILTPHPNFMISHYRNLISNQENKPITFIIPTDLESTTYFVTINGDIFTTILRPSGSFDKLTSSFNFRAVGITISVLILGIAFMLPQVRYKQLESSWIF